MESLIKRRRLGRTNLSITELGFGAMNLRLLASFEEAYEIVNYVLDQGINFIDTARAYQGEIAPGVMLESEQVVGDVIRKRTDLKEPIVLITKGHGYTIPELEKNLADSLRTLGVTGRGDLRIGSNPVKLIYFLHGISTERWQTIQSSGVLERLQQLKADGVVNYVGFSSHYPFPAEIKAAVDTGVFDVVELPYNVFDRSLGEDGATDLLAYIAGKDIGLINMKAFNGNGMLPLYPIVRKFIDMDYEKMLRFVLSNPYITSVDAGAKYTSEYAQDIKTALGDRYTPQELTELKAEADKVSKLMDSICRECMHCMEKFECPNKIDFQKILSIYSQYLVLDRLGQDTSDLFEQYRRLARNGGDCLACGACTPWCEYRLDIPQMLKASHELFGQS